MYIKCSSSYHDCFLFSTFFTNFKGISSLSVSISASLTSSPLVCEPGTMDCKMFCSRMVPWTMCATFWKDGVGVALHKDASMPGASSSSGLHSSTISKGSPLTLSFSSFLHPDFFLSRQEGPSIESFWLKIISVVSSVLHIVCSLKEVNQASISLVVLDPDFFL